MKKCPSCGQRRSHAPDCQRRAIKMAEQREGKHPETAAELAERSRRRRGKRRGYIQSDRATAQTRQSRQRRGWTLDDKGDFVPDLPEPVGRFPPNTRVLLIPGMMGSRYTTRRFQQ